MLTIHESNVRCDDITPTQIYLYLYMHSPPLTKTGELHYVPLLSVGSCIESNL